MEPRGWHRDDLANVVHVYPVNDLKPHDLSSRDCHCHPRVERVPDKGWVVVHNSYDGREVIEDIEILMGTRCAECGHYINDAGERVPPPDRIDEV